MAEKDKIEASTEKDMDPVKMSSQEDQGLLSTKSDNQQYVTTTKSGRGVKRKNLDINDEPPPKKQSMGPKSPAKSSSTPKTVSTPSEKKKSTPRIEGSDIIHVALENGWRKEYHQRKSGIMAGKFDVYYFSPNAKKLRSRNEVQRYHEQNEIDFIPEDFKFAEKPDAVREAEKSTAGGSDVFSDLIEDLRGMQFPVFDQNPQRSEADSTTTANNFPAKLKNKKEKQIQNKKKYNLRKGKEESLKRRKENRLKKGKVKLLHHAKEHELKKGKSFVAKRTKKAIINTLKKQSNNKNKYKILRHPSTKTQKRSEKFKLFKQKQPKNVSLFYSSKSCPIPSCCGQEAAGRSKRRPTRSHNRRSLSMEESTTDQSVTCDVDSSSPLSADQMIVTESTTISKSPNIEDSVEATNDFLVVKEEVDSEDLEHLLDENQKTAEVDPLEAPVEDYVSEPSVSSQEIDELLDNSLSSGIDEDVAGTAAEGNLQEKLLLEEHAVKMVMLAKKRSEEMEEHKMKMEILTKLAEKASSDFKISFESLRDMIREVNSIN